MKNNLFKFALICIIFHFLRLGLQGQSPSPFFPSTPASPNAAELGKFGSVPVNYYSGIADISIPLYNFKCGSYTLPISLNYHGGGIKINEIATWVGLGWNLSAGGGITVGVKGARDFAKERITPRTKEELQQLNLPTDYELIGMADHSIDAEPDVYNYNFCGHSGQFVMDHDFNVHFLKNNDGLEIGCNRVFIPGSFGGHWEATFFAKDNDGIKYYFELFETTHRVDCKRGYNVDEDKFYDEMPNNCDVDDPGVNGDLETNWMLTKIELANNIDYILFQYHVEAIQYETGYYGTVSAFNRQEPYKPKPPFEWTPSMTYDDFKSSRITNNARILESITSSRDGSKILFKTDIQRQDIPGTYALSAIEIWATTNRLFNWTFNYDNYFISDITPDPSRDFFGNPLTLRLKLNSLTRKSGDLSLSDPPYVFKYFGDDSNENDLPPRNCLDGFDHWGYANKPSNSLVLRPSRLFPSDPGGSARDMDFVCIFEACNWNESEQKCMGGQINATKHFWNGDYVEIPAFNGGDRTPNGIYAKSFSLKKIIYPTGGSKLFDYEGNTYKEVFSHNYNGSVGEDQPCGGIRIKSISDSQDGNNAFDVRTFDYHHGGVLFGMPFYVQALFATNNNSENEFFDCESSGSPQVDIGGYNLYSNSIEPLYMFGADNIGYSVVSEITSQGSVDYYYYSGTNYSNDYDFYYAFKEDSYTSNMYYSYIHGSSNIYPLTLDYTTGELTGESYKRGLLDKVIYNKADGITPVKKEVFVYNYVAGADVIGNRVVEVDDGPGSMYYFLNAYYLKTGKSFLETKSVKFYDNALNTIETVTDETNNAYYEQLQTSTLLYNNGDELKTTYIYPNDIYSGIINGCTPEACGLNQLYTQQRLSKPIEVIEEKNNQLIKANLTSYKTQDNTSTGVAVPYKEYAIESNTPFTKDNTVIHYNSGTGLSEFSFDPKYKLKGEYDFDQFGNVKSYTKTDDVETSFYYGYWNTLPVIKAENVSYYVLNMAVTSIQSNFEAFLEGLGDLSDPTTQIPAWQHFNLALRAALPYDARVVTYTYVPMIGMTSKTDENSITTYYYYDKLGRLIVEKDNDENITKKYDYHYAGQ